MICLYFVQRKALSVFALGTLLTRKVIKEYREAQGGLQVSDFLE